MPKSLHHCCRIYCSLDAEITALVIAENTALLDAVNSRQQKGTPVSRCALHFSKAFRQIALKRNGILLMELSRRFGKFSELALASNETRPTASIVAGLFVKSLLGLGDDSIDF